MEMTTLRLTSKRLRLWLTLLRWLVRPLGDLLVGRGVFFTQQRGSFIMVQLGVVDGKVEAAGAGTTVLECQQPITGEG